MINIIIAIFVFEGGYWLAVVLDIAVVMAGLLAVWPVNYGFTFFDRFAAGMAGWWKTGCDLPWISWVMCMWHNKMLMPLRLILASGTPVRKRFVIQPLQAQGFLLLKNQPGWVPRKRFPGYDQRLSLPWMQPRESISGYPWALMPNLRYKRQSFGYSVPGELSRPGKMSRVLQQVLPSNRAHLRNGWKRNRTG